MIEHLNGRRGLIAAMAAATALVLSACGTDDNTETSRPAGQPSPSADGCATGTIQASGSSAQANAMSEWVKTYYKECDDATVNYQSVGSGAGIQAFIQGSTAFAGSDSALKDDEVAAAAKRCGGNPALNLPMVVGPVALAYNLSGVEDLTLTPQLAAGIFSGKITRWNASEIAQANPGAKLPDRGIQAFHRSDSSGTTDNFTKWLTAAAGPAWTYESGKEWKAPGGQGAKGNEGVTTAVKQADGAIGYVELSFAENAGLGMARVDNGGGAVELTTETAAKALEAATVSGTGNDVALKLDYATKQPGAYPIVLVTYEITCSKGLPAAQLALVKSFLSFTAGEEGQGLLADLGYAPLPDSIQSKVQAAVASLS